MPSTRIPPGVATHQGPVHTAIRDPMGQDHNPQQLPPQRAPSEEIERKKRCQSITEQQFQKPSVSKSKVSTADLLRHLTLLCLCVSRIPLQRSGPRGCGGPWPRSTSPAACPGGRQLLLPAALRPADVHHAHTVQQNDSHRWQRQRNGGGQGRLPVSVFFVSQRVATQGCINVNKSFMLAESASAVGVTAFWVTT